MEARQIPLTRKYDYLAYLWPLISPPQDYKAEASEWRDALQRWMKPGCYTAMIHDRQSY